VREAAHGAGPGPRAKAHAQTHRASHLLGERLRDLFINGLEALAVAAPRRVKLEQPRALRQPRVQICAERARRARQRGKASWRTRQTRDVPPVMHTPGARHKRLTRRGQLNHLAPDPRCRQADECRNHRPHVSLARFHTEQHPTIPSIHIAMAIRGRTYAVFLLLGAAGTASGFQTPAFLPALARAAGWPQLRRLAAASAGRRAGRPAPAARAQCSVEQWCEAADQNGLHARANALPAEDVRALLEAAMSGEPKRRDTFAEVGGGRGEAMAAALTLYPEIGQTALFLPEDQQEVHPQFYPPACRTPLYRVPELLHVSRRHKGPSPRQKT